MNSSIGRENRYGVLSNVFQKKLRFQSDRRLPTPRTNPKVTSEVSLEVNNRTLVVFDPHLKSLFQLVAGVRPGAEILILSSEQDSVEQITQYLAHSYLAQALDPLAPQDLTKIQAIHLVCHGAPGMLQLGQTALNQANLKHYRSQLQAWNVEEILIYGCQVGASLNPLEPLKSSELKDSFLHRLHQLTGANLAASSTPIGNPQLGGNWELDVRIGTVRSPLAFTPQAQAAYPATLITLVVNSLGDEPDTNPGDGAALTALGTATLRAALEEANSQPGLDTIVFSIPTPDPVTGTFTIRPTSPLPSLNSPVAINGATQPGFLGNPIIELDGTNAGIAEGLVLNAGSTTIQGLMINRFTLDGLVINSDRNSVQGNFIGTDITGNGDRGNGLDGIRIALAASNNQIGGVRLEGSLAQGNLISGNGGNGISASLGSGNQIQGNIIGAGLGNTGSPLANADNGITLSDTSGNLIGGTTFGTRNLIFGNGGNGVLITGEQSTNNLIQNNNIQFHETGAGVLIGANASNTLIGGANAGNLVTENSRGVVITDLLSIGNRIYNNRIYNNFPPESDVPIEIDLNGDGATLNDAQDSDAGANTLQNTPDLNTAIVGPTNLGMEAIRINGSLNSIPGSSYTLQFFANPFTGGFPEEPLFIGEIQLETNPSGNGPFTAVLPIPGGLGGVDFTQVIGTATDISGNTSEFSNVVELIGQAITLPIVSLAPGLLPNEAGSVPGTFTLSLDSAASGGLTVNYTLTGSTALSPVDFSLVPGDNITALDGDSFTLAAGATTATLQVVPLDDSLIDPNEQVQLNLTTALGYGLGTPTAVLAIQDNDVAGLQVQPISGLVTREDGGLAPFTVALTAQPTMSVSVSLNSNDLTEGTVSTPELIFTPGDWNIPQTVTVAGVNDLGVDPDVPYTVTVGAEVTSSDPSFNSPNVAAVEISLTNTDNDVATIVIPTAGRNTREDGRRTNRDSFPVVLTSQPTTEVWIDLQSSDLTEGRILGSPRLIFNATNWNVPQTVTIEGLDDNSVDGNVGYRIETRVTTTDPSYSSLDPADVSVNNVDNDTASIHVNPTAGLTTTEIGGFAAFDVVLTSEPTAEVTISLQSNNPAEGRASVSDLTFTPETWNTAQTVVVTGIDDAIADNNQEYMVILDVPVTSDPNYAALNPADVQVTNADNETPGIIVNPRDGLITTEAGGTDYFEVLLTSEPTRNVTITVASSNLQEGIVTENSTIVLTADNWNEAQVVTVAGVDDTQADGPLEYTLVTTVSTEDRVYRTLDAADIQVMNLDNDRAGIQIDPTTGLRTSEAEGTATFNLVLESEPLSEVILNLSSTNLGEGILSSPVVTFTPENWDIVQTVTVAGVDDAIADGNVAYTIVTEDSLSFDPSYNGIELPDIVVVNSDNDVPGITVSPTDGLVTSESGATDTFTVVLNTQPTANVSLSLGSSDPTEGALSVSALQFTSANWFIPQTVTVTGVRDAVVDEDVTYAILTGVAQSDDLNYANLDPDDVSVINQNIDLPSVTLFVSTNSGEEVSMTAVTVTTTASAPVKGDQTVELGVVGTGITLMDYVLSAAQVVIPDGQTVGTASFTVIDDSRREPSEIATLTLSNPSAGMVLATPSTANITILDNDIAPTVEFAEASYRVNEGGNGPLGVLQVTLMRTGDTAEPSTVTVQFENGTALGGDDFENIPVTATFKAQETVALIEVPLFEDSIAEADETFALVLATTGDGTELGIQNTIPIEILDNETAEVNSSATGISVAEAGVGSSYDLVLTTQPQNPVTISFETGDPSGNQLNPITAITFDRENWAVPQTVTVAAVNDTAIEGRHQAVIRHMIASADTVYNGFSLPDVTVEIADDDQADVLVTPVSLPLTEGGMNESYQLVLTRPPVAGVTIAFDTGDQLNSIAAITFDPVNWSIPQTVIVSAVDDLEIEGEHLASVTHQLTSADANYAGLSIPSVQTIILDNDIATAVIFTPTDLTATEAGATASYTLVLDSAPTAPVTIDFVPDEQLASLDSIAFNSVNWDIPQTITVAAINDSQIESNHTGTITHRVRSEDNNFDGLEIPDLDIAIEDNDGAAVEIAQTAGNTQVSEDGATDTYRVVLSAQPSTPVRVVLSPDSQLNLGNGTEGVVELVFTAETWDIAQTVTVAAVDDEDIEAATHTSTINHAVQSDDPNYNPDTPIRIDGTRRANLTVAITENDQPLPPGTPGFKLIQPARQTEVLEGFGQDVYKLFLTSEPTAPVTITIDSGSQIQTDQPALTFDPDNWNIPQTVTVTAVDDPVQEEQQVSLITHIATSLDPRYDGLEVEALDITISDNDNLGEQFRTSEPVVYSFSDADDRGSGSGSGDIFYGNSGNDVLSGEGGDDLILGQAGADGLSGDEGNDVLIGGQDNDQISSSAGEDVLFGDRGSDRLHGGQDNDQLFGNFGNDRLLGEQGSDTLAGGRGNDAFVLGLGTGVNNPGIADRILDFADTEDVIELQGTLTFDQLELLSSADGTLIQVQATGEYLALLENIEVGSLTAQDFI
ncbi:MAG: DUF4347 domain-containing protein [Microcoleaceae cyanobacterium]